MKVLWQEQVRGEWGWCESQTSLMVEDDVDFQECLENQKKFNFQQRWVGAVFFAIQNSLIPN